MHNETGLENTLPVARLATFRGEAVQMLIGSWRHHQAMFDRSSRQLFLPEIGNFVLQMVTFYSVKDIPTNYRAFDATLLLFPSLYIRNLGHMVTRQRNSPLGVNSNSRYRCPNIHV
jgi:hypothetical protein